MATKKQPTRKQLAARKRFVAMVKARAREAAAQKRAAGYRLVQGKWVAPKAGKKRATTKRRNAETRSSAHPISVRHYFRAGPPGYESAWKRAERHGQQRLFAMNPKKRKAKGVAVSVMKAGRRLYGAAAAAVLAKRGAKANPKRRSTLLSGRKRNPRFEIGDVVRPRWQIQGHQGPASTYETGTVIKKSSGRYQVDFGKGRHYWVDPTGLVRNNGKRNGWLGSQVKQALSKRLHAPIRLRRKRNQGTPSDIAAMHEKFLGRPTEGHFDITAPQGTPKDVAVLGSLVCLKTEDEDFEFDKGEAYLGADGRGNLYVLGDTTPVETNTNFGHIEEIRYEAKKDHLNPFRWRKRRSRRNSNVVEYFHYFGEEDGVMPKLKSDSDGLLHISGGNYKVEAEGIIN